MHVKADRLLLLRMTAATYDSFGSLADGSILTSKTVMKVLSASSLAARTALYAPRPASFAPKTIDENRRMRIVMTCARQMHLSRVVAL